MILLVLLLDTPIWSRISAISRANLDGYDLTSMPLESPASDGQGGFRKAWKDGCPTDQEVCAD